MSRGSTIVTIAGRGEITVKEVSPMAVLQAMQAKDAYAELRVLINDAVEFKDGDILALYPSELEQVVRAFLEVNKSFLTIADLLRISGMVGDLGNLIKEKLLSFLPDLFATSYRLALEKRLSGSAGNSSLPPSVGSDGAGEPAQAVPEAAPAPDKQ